MPKEELEEFIIEEHLEYLDLLRESGVTNMYGARPYIQRAYPELTKSQATKILTHWMETFGERHPTE